MPTRRLPSNPDLDQLRNQARDLQRDARDGDADALAAVEEHHPRLGAADAGRLKLADAQLVVARTYGFPSWSRLHRHLDVVSGHARSPHDAEPDAEAPAPERFLALACLRYGNGDSPERWAAAADLLAADPSLATTSIWTMAAAGEAEAARRLLDASPELAHEPGGPFRWPPLLYAAFSRVPLDRPRSRLAVAEALLDHGADPDAGYLWEGLPSPFTALTGAFGGGEDAVNQPPHPDGHALATLLLERGADPNDDQALYNRMFDPDDAHLVLLFEHGLGRGDGGPWRDRMPDATESIAAMLAMQLQWAASHGMVERVRLLLAHGVDPDGQSGHPVFGGRSAAELAAQRGDDAIADELVAAGATATTLGPEDQLVAACLRADRTAAERLIADDPEIVSRVEQHEGPMVLAAEARTTDAMRLMVDLGFDVNALGRITALHEAASTGDVDTVRVLLELGADPNVRDRAVDAPPLGWARHGGHDEVAAILEPLTSWPIDDDTT